MKEKIVYIVIGVLVLMACLIGLVFFINTPNSSPKEDNTSTYSEISITDEAVKELYQNINASSDLSFNYSLLKDNNITNAYMLGVSLASALNSGKNMPITKADLAVYIRKIFGNVTVNYEDIILNNQKYSFDSDKDEYNIKEIYDYDKTDKILSKLVSAKKSTTEYILTIKLVVANPKENNIYSDIDCTTIIGSDENPDIEKYLNEASTYNYHFTFNGETFVLTSVTK